MTVIIEFVEKVAVCDWYHLSVLVYVTLLTLPLLPFQEVSIQLPSSFHSHTSQLLFNTFVFISNRDYEYRQIILALVTGVVLHTAVRYATKVSQALALALVNEVTLANLCPLVSESEVAIWRVAFNTFVPDGFLNSTVQFDPTGMEVTSIITSWRVLASAKVISQIGQMEATQV